MNRPKKILSAATTLLALTGIGMIAALRPGQIQTTEKVVRKLGAESAADTLRYLPYCSVWEEYLLLSTRGPAALWAHKNQKLSDSLALNLRRGERERITETLQRLHWGPHPGRAEVDELIALARTQDAPLRADLMRNVVCASFSHATDRASVERVLRPQLTSQSAPERKEYATILTFADCPESTPHLRRLLDDPDDEVRAQAIYALSFRHDPSLAPRYLAYLDDPSDHIRRAAWMNLFRYSFPGKRERILQDIHSKNDRIRLRGIRSLSFSPEKQDILILRKFLHGKNIEIQEAVTCRLAIAEDKASYPTFRRWLRDSNPDRRRIGMRALYWANDRESIPEFRRLLSDPGCREFAQYVLNSWDVPTPRSLSSQLPVLQIGPWFFCQGD
jgi:hypothetical protein